MKLLTPAKIINNHPELTPKDECRFIYFLIDDDEIVYVGQTKNALSERLMHHEKKYRQFDRVERIEVKAKYADIVESCYIHSIRPKYNGNVIHKGSVKQEIEKRAPLTISSMCERLCEMVDMEDPEGE